MAVVSLKGRLGDRLVEKGMLTPERLAVALAEQKRVHRPLGRILLGLGFVREADITALLAEDFGLDFVRAGEVHPDPLILSALDPAFVRETMAFPYRLEDGTLHVLVFDPSDTGRLAQLRARFPYPLRLALTTEEDLHALARAHLAAQRSEVAALFATLNQGSEGPRSEAVPVEELTQAILLDGIRRQATDIHLEPDEHLTRVRYRVDGMLQSGENLPAAATAAILSRLKILAHLDISERRRPQDGRLRLTLDEREVDMRVSILPTQYGENIVLRVLSSAGAGVLRLANLGLGPEVAAALDAVARRPHGLFLVTGPTGSGKTTTLYSMLAEVDAVHRKVATIEDPIEYRLALLRQTQVDPAIGFTFATGLRSLLRQDPDVILVGEIRDQETADMALKASMTGHLVLSTLHTNSALGAVPRLVDMGIESFLVLDALVGVLSQRLVRRVCAGCAQSVAAEPRELAWLGAEAGLELRRGRGCPACDGSGYHGRQALVELFFPDAVTADALRAGMGTAELEELARARGFRSMEENGRSLVRAGQTTMDEVQRVSRGRFLTAEERAGL